jgi:hypothetical protein
MSSILKVMNVRKSDRGQLALVCLQIVVAALALVLLSVSDYEELWNVHTVVAVLAVGTVSGNAVRLSRWLRGTVLAAGLVGLIGVQIDHGLAALGPAAAAAGVAAMKVAIEWFCEWTRPTGGESAG